MIFWLQHKINNLKQSAHSSNLQKIYLAYMAIRMNFLDLLKIIYKKN
jgi:hypothetical protein